MTPHNSHKPVNEDYMVIGLQVLGQVVSDPELRERFLALSGLDADGLRARAGEPGLLAAAIAFLAAHEADLVRTAAALDLPPARIMRAGTALAGDEA